MNHHVKYPRTFHLPWSLGATDDDKTLPDIECFKYNQVVVTEKLDGENSTLYNDHYHARSLSSGHHPSRAWIKQLHAEIAYNIPEGWRICGENLFAKHSIFYEELASYFYVFSIWNERNVCLSWHDTLEWCEMLGLIPAPVLYEGVWNETAVKSCWTGKSKVGGLQEGYVVRLAQSFSYEEFSWSVGKYVRKDHVQTSEHWMQQKITPNLLKINVQNHT